MVRHVTSKTVKVRFGTALLALLFGLGPAITLTPAASAAETCGLTAQQNPVVLIHDVAASGSVWRQMAASLRTQGRCVQIFDYGRNSGIFGLLPGGLTSIAASSQELADDLTQLRASAPDVQIDLIAHGTGSLVAMSYLQAHRRDHAVRSLISLGPLWNGTNVGGLGTLEQLSRDAGTYQLVLSIEAPLEDPVCTVCREMIMGSDFIRAMRASGIIMPGVRQVNIMTADDWFVVPMSSGSVAGMTNIVLQDLDPSTRVGHGGMPRSAPVIRRVVQLVGS